MQWHSGLVSCFLVTGHVKHLQAGGGVKLVG